MTTEDIRRRARAEVAKVTSMETADYLLDRPPGGWDSLATKDDLNGWIAVVDHRFEEVDRRFEEVNGAFGEVNRGFAGIDQRFTYLETTLAARFDTLDTKIDTKIDGLAHQMSGLIDKAFASQIRWIVGTMIGLVGVLGAVIVALAKL